MPDSGACDMPWWMWLLCAAAAPLGLFLLYIVGATIVWRATAGRSWHW